MKLLVSKKAILNTVHGYTASQSRRWTKVRKICEKVAAAAQNIVPSSTGAAIAVTKAYPELTDLLMGFLSAYRYLGVYCRRNLYRETQYYSRKVNEILKKASIDSRGVKFFAVTEEPLVSSDILANPHASNSSTRYDSRSWRKPRQSPRLV